MTQGINLLLLEYPCIYILFYQRSISPFHFRHPVELMSLEKVASHLGKRRNHMCCQWRHHLLLIEGGEQEQSHGDLGLEEVGLTFIIILVDWFRPCYHFWMIYNEVT
jgi:hypothetical protein